MRMRAVSLWQGVAAAVVAIIFTAATANAVGGLYVSGGAGGTTDRLALGANVTYKVSLFTVSARAIMTDSNDKSTAWFTDHTTDFALLVGRSSQFLTNKFSATIEGGISSVTISRVKYSIRPTAFGDVLSADDKTDITKVGVAVQSQLYVWRVGVLLFGNLNREDTFFGALACFRFGKVN